MAVPFYEPYRTSGPIARSRPQIGAVRYRSDRYHSHMVPALVTLGRVTRHPSEPDVVPSLAPPRPTAQVVAAATVLTLGVAVLIGWAVGSPSLKSVVPGMITMKVNTAAGLILLAVALLGIGRCGPAWRAAVPACLALVTALAVMTLAEYGLGVDLHIDQAVFRDAVSARFPGRNAPATNVAFLGLTAGLALVHTRRAVSVGQVLLGVAACLPLATLGGYLYRAPGMYRDAPYPVIALNTSVGLMLVSVGGLLARRRDGLMGVVTSASLAGSAARRLLPAAVGLPVATGLLVLAGERAGWYTVAFGSALLVACCSGFFAAAVCFTVTLLYRTERKLGERGQRLRIAMETAHLVPWQLDLTTGAFDCPDGWRATLGGRPGRSLHRDQLMAAIHPDDRAAVVAALDRAVRNRTDFHAEYRVPVPPAHAGGPAAVRWVVASGRGINDGGGDNAGDADGGPARVVGVMLDVTDRKTADADRERLLAAERDARADAERANRTKDEFLSVISHELRTPLNAILGWAQLLHDAPDADDVAEGVRTIERNARAQVQIIEDLLDMGRIVSGRLRLDVRPVDLRTVVDAAVAALRPAAAARDIDLAADPVPDDALPAVHADAGRLQQVVANLLGNAVKFTPHGGRVRVTVARAGPAAVAVTVADTGQGIAAEFLPFVFDRFRQADASTTRRFGGLGLGLSIVKQMVDLHGGTVAAASGGVDRGSTFTVTLPTAGSHADVAPLARPTATARRPAGRPDLRGVRVLVVDDEPDARGVARRHLEACGATVPTAASADEAFAAVSADPPDVLVSDVGMPGENGYSLIARVRRLPPAAGGGVPAVALTAYARSEDRDRAIAAGFQLHLVKPADAADLTAAVASLARPANAAACGHPPRGEPLTTP